MYEVLFTNNAIVNFKHDQVELSFMFKGNAQCLTIHILLRSVHLYLVLFYNLQL